MPSKAQDAPNKGAKKNTKPRKQTKAQRNSQLSPEKKPLTNQEKIFVKEYINCKNARKAAEKAGFASTTAHSKAYQWVSNSKVKPNVYAAVQRELKKLEEKLDMSAENVLKTWWRMATANPNQLVENRRVPCRYCHGKHGKYQYTQGERDRAYEAHIDKLISKDKDPKKFPFDEKGGVGYSIHREINESCAECHGLGVEHVIMHDTNNVPPEVLALYGGVKETRHGKEIIMHSKEKALENIARHLGLFNDKLKLQGDEDNPLYMLINQMGSKALRPKEDE